MQDSVNASLESDKLVLYSITHHLVGSVFKNLWLIFMAVVFPLKDNK